MSAKDTLEKKFNITVSDNALNLSQIQEGMPHYRVETDYQNLICEKSLSYFAKLAGLGIL